MKIPLDPRFRALLIGALLAFLTLELGVRLLTLFPGNTDQFVPDPLTGFRQRPGVEIGGSRTNSRGFNDAEPTASKTGRRLGVVGDSFVFGAVERSRNFVSLLGKNIPQEADLQVLNLGILAAGPENYLGVLEKDGVELALDAALVVLFVGNDVSQADPDFKTRIFLGSPRAVLRSPWLVRPALDYLYSVKTLRGGWRLLREEALTPEPGGTFSRQVFFEIERGRLEACRRAPHADIERGFLGIAAFFDQLRRIENERGISIAVAIAPDQYQVDRALQAELLAGDAADFDLGLPQERLIGQLESRAMRFVDLLPALRRAAEAEGLYVERDTHWNVAGNRVVAEVLRESLRSWGWLGTPLDSRAAAD